MYGSGEKGAVASDADPAHRVGCACGAVGCISEWIDFGLQGSGRLVVIERMMAYE